MHHPSCNGKPYSYREIVYIRTIVRHCRGPANVSAQETPGVPLGFPTFTNPFSLSDLLQRPPFDGVRSARYRLGTVSAPPPFYGGDRGDHRPCPPGRGRSRSSGFAGPAFGAGHLDRPRPYGLPACMGRLPPAFLPYFPPTLALPHPAPFFWCRKSVTPHTAARAVATRPGHR